MRQCLLSVEVDFYNANGELAKSQQIALRPGQVGRPTLTRFELNGLSYPHVLFWVQATVLGACNGNASCSAKLCQIETTGEVEDALGNTKLVFTGPQVAAPVRPASD